MPVVYSILAKPELIKEVYRVSSEGIEFDEPQPWESLSDAADSPIGPQEIQAGLQLLTVALQSAAAMAVFAGTLIDLKKKMEPKDGAAIIDPKNGKTLLRIDQSTPDETIRASLQQE
jgi:hypothetical protein